MVIPLQASCVFARNIRTVSDKYEFKHSSVELQTSTMFGDAWVKISSAWKSLIVKISTSIISELIPLRSLGNDCGKRGGRT